MTPRGFLRSSIALARRVEVTIPPGRLYRRKALVGYGFLVRQRRLAAAILKLDTAHAYEGRMLLRSMIEIIVNYSWIRGGKGHSRAQRFISFDPLERLEILQEIAAIIPSDRVKNLLRALREERAKLRHLFRRKDKKGKAFWTKHWASTIALPDRLKEILKVDAAKTGQPIADTFLYGLYRWTSSAVHGGPVSLAEVLVIGGPGPVPRRQPEGDPTAQFLAAGMMLVATIDRLTVDARWRRPYRATLASLVKTMRVLKEEKNRGK